MKRLVIALALVALMSSSVFAEGMTLGFKGGLNLANLSGDDIEGMKMKLCFGGGVFLNYQITESISLQPELLFVMKGAKVDEDEVDAGFKASYIDIPVLAKFSVPMEGAFAPCFFAGPYIGFNMSAKMYFEDEEIDFKDSVKSTDFGLVFGGGFDYDMGEGYLSFDARYALGLTTLDDSDLEEDVKNTGIMFMVGYGFDF
ncbi:MAG: PorT family protein [Candidatus Krumholzibacteriota bacterium]|nr:PorT family protein [Candidatus Krumholzibacteriota bacterium]